MTRAISRYRQKAFASSIWRGVLQDTSNSAVLATITATHRARDTATFRRFRRTGTPCPSGRPLDSMLPSNRGQRVPPALGTCPRFPPSPWGKSLNQCRDLRVVRSHDEDVLKPESIGLAFFVRPSCLGLQQPIDQSAHTLHLFWRFVLVASVLDRKKAKTCRTERIVSVEALPGVFGARNKPALVENLRRERADIWVQAACFGEEYALFRTDGCMSIQEMPKSRDVRAGRMNTLLRLV